MLIKLMTLVLLANCISGCSSNPLKKAPQFETVIKTNGFYYQEVDSTKTIAELGGIDNMVKLADHPAINRKFLEFISENRYYMLTFDDVLSKKLTYIILSNPVIEGKIDEQSIKKKINSEYSVSNDPKGGYKIRFYENKGDSTHSYSLKANENGDIERFTFIPH